MLIAQSYLTVCDHMDCSPPGSFVHGISQAKILEWVAISFSRGSSWPRDQTCVFCIAGGFFITEVPRKPFENHFVIKNWNFGKNYILHPHWFTNVTHILLLIISSVEQYITREWMIHTCNSNKQLRFILSLTLLHSEWCQAIFLWQLHFLSLLREAMPEGTFSTIDEYRLLEQDGGWHKTTDCVFSICSNAILVFWILESSLCSSS